MAQVRINGIAYETEELSDEIKDHLRYMAHIDADMERLTMQMDVLRIARAEIGGRLDKALLQDQINQAKFVAQAQEPGVGEQ